MVARTTDKASKSPTWRRAARRKLMKKNPGGKSPVPISKYPNADLKPRQRETMKPQQLYQTHPQYNDYPLAVFRGHLYQEVRFFKFCTWRNETGVKKTTDWM